MIDQPSPERLRINLPIKGIVISAVGIGLSFGLCGVSAMFGFNSSMSVISIGVFVLSVVGLFVCILWLIIAGIVNSFKH
jgi:hypothetical protein